MSAVHKYFHDKKKSNYNIAKLLCTSDLFDNLHLTQQSFFFYNALVRRSSSGSTLLAREQCIILLVCQNLPDEGLWTETLQKGKDC